MNTGPVLFDSAAKERITRQQEQAEKLRIFKVRLATDDGWYFFAATDRKQAAILAQAMWGVKADVLSAATQAELTVIAARALEGLY